jgi:hypothetical protein
MRPDDPDRPMRVYAAPTAKPLGVFCPYCGAQDEYGADELKSRTLTVLPPEVH